MDHNFVEVDDFEELDNIDDNRMKCGEIMLINNRKISFGCSFCGKEIQSIGTFLRHILKQHLTFSKEDFDALLINAKKKQAAKIEQNIHTEAIQHDEEKLMDLGAEQQSIKIERNIDETDEQVNYEMINSYQHNFEKMLHKSEQNEYELSPNSRFDENFEGMEFLDQFFVEVPSETKKENTSNEVGFEIEVLPFATMTRSIVNKYENSTHTTDIELAEPALVSKAPRIFCKICKKVFRNEEILSVHMERHSEATARPYVCEYCEARFAHKSNFNVHVNRHLGVKPFTCKECNKGFHSSTELKLHQVSHTGDRKYKCNDCDRTFTRRQLLVCHSRRHYDERPYDCKECGKKYFTSHQLRTHETTHKAERPFSCEVCGSTFKRRKALREHSKLHSGIKKYECKICDRSFAQYAGLYSHMKIHNKD